MPAYLRKIPAAVVWILFLSVIILASGDAGASIKDLPFKEGERLVYRAKWEFLSAGRVVMEVLPFKTPEGENIYHFKMDTRTNSGMDTFYRVREMQDSYTDKGLTRTLLYVKRSTGKHPRDIRVDFDWEHMQATYANFGKTEKSISILPGTLDPLALIYSIRMKELRTGAVLELPVTDGKECAVIRATVTARETITIDGRSYETFVIVPETNTLKGLLDKLPKLKIWCSVEEGHIPVKIQSRFAIGSFAFELVSTNST
ncbi:MAG: DUF3108 domain-containing protein [Syntrophales bacterium]